MTGMVMRHGTVVVAGGRGSGDVGVQVGSGSRTSPVRGGGGKDAAGTGRGRDASSAMDNSREIEFGGGRGVVVVTSARHHGRRRMHEQVRRLVRCFVRRWISRCRLSRLREALEVELVRVPFAMHFGHDVLVVVVAESATQLVIVHVRLALPLAPPASHLVRVREFKFAVRALPRDAVRVGRVRQ